MYVHIPRATIDNWHSNCTIFSLEHTCSLLIKCRCFAADPERDNSVGLVEVFAVNVHKASYEVETGLETTISIR